jgi:hypothetical protein
LPSKHEALSKNPNNTNKTRKGREGERERRKEEGREEERRRRNMLLDHKVSCCAIQHGPTRMHCLNIGSKETGPINYGL